MSRTKEPIVFLSTASYNIPHQHVFFKINPRTKFTLIARYCMTHIHTHKHTHTRTAPTHTHTRTQTHTRTYTRTHAHTQTHTYIYIYINTHTPTHNTHTYTHKRTHTTYTLTHYTVRHRFNCVDSKGKQQPELRLDVAMLKKPVFV